MVDYTFADGTFVPKGYVVGTPLMATHFDESRYKDAHKFDGFRFANDKSNVSTTSLDYLAWGAGFHACPGRFFAVNEIKAIMALLIPKYDVKLENPGVRPPDRWIGVSASPNASAKVMFRLRPST